MDRTVIALIINGLVVAGLIAAFVFGKVDLPTLGILIGIATAPGAGNALLDSIKPKAPPPADKVVGFQPPEQP